MTNISTYGMISLADESQAAALRQIDNDCASCRVQAEKKATSDILAAVIENELTESERNAVKLRWFNNMTCTAIADECGTTPGNIRKTVKRAEKKIYNAMKYVVLYDDFVCGCEKMPQNFHFKIINCTNGKELIH